MAQELDLFLRDQTTSLVESLSREAAEEVDRAYHAFFFDMLGYLGMDALPRELRGYSLPWEDLSALWVHQKIKHGRASDTNQAFYIGITREQAAAKAARSTKRRRKKAPVKPFSEYISSLQNSGAVDRFFGPVTLKYEFQSPRLNETVSVRTGRATARNPTPHRNQITSVRVQDNYLKKRVSDLKDHRVIGTIEAFKVFEMVQKTEWAMVDYIIRKVDAANKKQWQKINGTKGPRGTMRPIRAIILPMVQYFINERLPDELREVMKS